VIRAVIDTNILISGLLFGGIPLKIIKAGLDRRFYWVTSPFLLEELERTLNSKKFGLRQDEIKALTAPIYDACNIIVPTTRIAIIKRCPADNRVIECALDGECSYFACFS
jgi:putative PIN family toxin of toxin-antitoxin system